MITFSVFSFVQMSDFISEILMLCLFNQRVRVKYTPKVVKDIIN